MGGNDLFSDQELKKMIVPLFLEQLLVMFVGLADTLVISYAGESAVSGVSLVNQFNTIFIYLFTALASGGAAVISQYIGRQDTDLAGESASQLLMFSFGFSVLLGAAVLLGNEAMLCLLFGKVEQPVMEACMIYMRISAYSYPALAVYNAGAACLSQSWKNKCDDVSLSSVQCDQCYWQCDRCFCFSRRGSRCCMAVLPCPCFFRSDHHFSLLSGKEQGGV